MNPLAQPQDVQTAAEIAIYDDFLEHLYRCVDRNGLITPEHMPEVARATLMLFEVKRKPEFRRKRTL